MVIIWGEKYFRKKMGYVADFCPYCRDFQTVQLTEITFGPHFYYMQSGQTRFIRMEGKCAKCQGRYNAGTLKNFPLVGKKASPDVGQMLVNTQPEAKTRYAERLELERLCRESPGSLSPEQRAQLLLEPFATSSAISAEMARSELWIDLRALGGMALAWSLVGLAIWWAIRSSAEMAIMLPLLLGCVALGISLYSVQGGGRRRVGRIFRPRLQEALRDLRPTREELEQFWPELHGHVYAKVLRLEDFLEGGRR